MSFNRLPYDICSYKHELAESVGEGMYRLGTPPNACEPCHAADPRIKLQSQGVSISRNTALIDIDSELLGITRNLSSCPDKKYAPTADNSFHCGAQTGNVVRGCQDFAKLCVDNKDMIHFSDCFTPSEDTRLSNPPCTLRGTGWNRWEWLCRNPQERVEVPYDFEINSRIVAKDNHRPCLPKPVSSYNVWPQPEDKPICENIVPVCMVPTNPPSVQWRNVNEIAQY